MSDVRPSKSVAFQLGDESGDCLQQDVNWLVCHVPGRRYLVVPDEMVLIVVLLN